MLSTSKLFSPRFSRFCSMTVFTRQRIGIFTCVFILLWMVFGIFVYTSWMSFPEDAKIMRLLPPEKQLESCKTFGRKLGYGFWKKVNLRRQSVPISVKESAAEVNVESKVATVGGINVHYLHARPKEENTIPVLLLHGQSYSSKTWRELGTIQLLSAMGYYPVAIDLPGFGKTPAAKSAFSKAYFIDNLITKLNLQQPVVISPSMSGAYSLQFLIEFPNKLGGFVPVSPVRTSILDQAACGEQDNDSLEKSFDADCQRILYLMKSETPKLNCLEVPTLAVWGEKDRRENSAKLCLLPESQGAEIPEGSHSAYRNNPDFWHKLLYNFLNTLNATKACR